MITVILAITLLFFFFVLCILNTFKIPQNLDFESEAVNMKVKETVQKFVKAPIMSGNINHLKNIGDYSLLVDEPTKMYRVSVNFSSNAVKKMHSTLNIRFGELDLLATKTSTLEEVVDVAIAFKPSGNLQSIIDALNNFRTQAKAYVSFGQIAANVRCIFCLLLS